MKGNAKQAALNQEDLKREKQIQEGNNTYLLQAAVIFLAVVSFFTTANGMKSTGCTAGLRWGSTGIGTWYIPIWFLL